jgi:hypothetical protein
MKRTSHRSSITLDQGFIADKLYRLEKLAESALDHLNELQDDLDTMPRRTPADFRRLAIRLEVVMRACRNVADEAGPGTDEPPRRYRRSHALQRRTTATCS